jgi:hypothetical protein
MGFRVIGTIDKKWAARKGLEGPFLYANGRVLYYDPKEGEYYDPLTDFYIHRDEIADLQNGLLEKLAK